MRNLDREFLPESQFTRVNFYFIFKENPSPAERFLAREIELAVLSADLTETQGQISDSMCVSTISDGAQQPALNTELIRRYSTCPGPQRAVKMGLVNVRLPQKGEIR